MPDVAEQQRTLRLLIIEDDEAQLRILTAIMEDAGFKVIGCSTAAALEHAARADVGVAVLDLHLPDLSGTALLKQLQARNRRLRVVINTAHASMGTAKDAVNLGAFAYVEKASGPRELIRHVHRAFRERLERYASDLEDAVVERTSDLRKANEKLEREIAERRQAEQALRESEERFRNIFENAPLGIYRTTPNGRILMANPALVNMLGYSSFEELAQRSLEDKGHHGDYPRERFKQEIERTGEVRGLEAAWVRKDGTIRFVRESARVVRDADGQTLHYEGTAEDITTRRQAEQALRESEHRYQELVNRMSSGVAVYRAVNDGEDFVFVQFNRSGERIDQVHWEDLIGQRVTEVFPGIKDFGLLDVFRRVWRTGQPERHPVSVYEDKRIKGWRENFVYRLPSGEVVAVYDDVTERRRAEEALRHEQQLLQILMESIPDTIYFKDRESRFTRVNHAQARLLGVDDPEQAVGKLDVEFFPRELAEQYRADEQRVIETGEPLLGKIEQVRHDAGEPRWLSTTKVPIRAAGGEIVGTVGISRDITEHKRAEEEIQQQLDELRRWHRVTLDREDRVRALKREVNELAALLGKVARYPSQESKAEEHHEPAACQ
jgi:PAS domain S-box-containing protein